jgi:hypothetical protein
MLQNCFAGFRMTIKPVRCGISVYFSVVTVSAKLSVYRQPGNSFDALKFLYRFSYIRWFSTLSGSGAALFTSVRVLESVSNRS